MEIINLQLSEKRNLRRKIIHWLLILLCIIIIITFVSLYLLNSPYFSWDYDIPENAVLGTVFHSFEWLFIRIAPVIFIIAIIGIVLTLKKD